MSEQNNVQNTTDEQGNEEEEVTTSTSEGTEDVNVEAADKAVETVEESAPEEEVEMEIPTIEDLLLRDHKEKVLGKDRISRKQMESYVRFLGYDPEADEPVNPLEGDFIVNVLGEYDTAMWARIAKQGKSALGPNAKDVHDAYIAMWEEWRDKQANRPPRSHMWLKGVVAAALLIAEHMGEDLTELAKEKPPTEEELAERAAQEAAEKEAEAKDKALAEGQDAPSEEPQQEQPAPDPADMDSDTSEEANAE